MVGIEQLKKDDEILISFPPGSPHVARKFIKSNKDKTKVQVREEKGRLMWYSAEFISEETNESSIDDREKLWDGVPLEQPSLDKESEAAQKELDKIKELKNSDNHVKKKVTKKHQIISLIKEAKSNKEICSKVGCDSGYVSDVRLALHKAGEISDEIYNVRHGGKSVSYEFDYKKGDKVKVFADGEERIGYVAPHEKRSSKIQFFVRVVGFTELFLFSRSTGIVKEHNAEEVYLITSKK
jgi:hypothetical protein